MPKYYFHIRDASALICDSEGSSLADFAAAESEARASVREFAIEALKHSEDVDRFEVEIHDETGVKLCVVCFADIARGDGAAK